ncbi:hypothetical protein HK097_010858 [Rhizophlyctis rosea]|uniref:Uncharacterized protein n=1 Tax=Rhizophlyctis rosea TaxID=64517 RepID=A0AAD5S8H1_9FUNG|nr:hypothetical protein HK097_010858 [Rhizophlyctis rosea]
MGAQSILPPTGNIFYGATIYLLLGTLFYTTCHSLPSTLPPHYKPRTQLFILSTTLLATYYTHIYERHNPQPIINHPPALNSPHPHAHTPPPSPTPSQPKCKPTLTNPINHVQIYTNTTLLPHDNPPILSCTPKSCPCLSGLARHKSHAHPCRLNTISDRPLSTSSPAVFSLEYWYECGHEGQGAGLVKTAIVRRIVSVLGRGHESWGLLSVGEGVRDLVVWSEGVVSAKSGKVKPLGAKSFEVWVVGGDGKKIDGLVSISSVTPNANISTLPAGVKTAGLRRSQILALKLSLQKRSYTLTLKWTPTLPYTTTLHIAPSKKHCFDAREPHGPCRTPSSTPITIPIPNPPTIKVKGYKRLDESFLLLRVHASEALRRKNSILPLSTKHFTITIGDRPLPVLGVRKVVKGKKMKPKRQWRNEILKKRKEMEGRKTKRVEDDGGEEWKILVKVGREEYRDGDVMRIVVKEGVVGTGLVGVGVSSGGEIVLRKG